MSSADKKWEMDVTFFWQIEETSNSEYYVFRNTYIRSPARAQNLCKSSTNMMENSRHVKKMRQFCLVETCCFW